ncbi:MAG: substrate-binding periplasmic protein [Pseudomonadales bacterium]
MVSNRTTLEEGSSTKVLILLLSITLSLTLQARQLTLSVGEGAIIQEVSALVLRQAYAELNVDMQLKVMPNARALKAANKGQVDADVSRIKGVDAKFSNLIFIPVEINYLQAYAFTADRKLVPTSWASLAGKRVVSVLGIKFVEKSLKKHNIEATFVPSFAQAMTLVERERADIAVFPDIVGLTAIREAGTETVKMRGKPLSTLPLYHYLHKKNKDLAAPLTKILERMQQDGSILRIREQYMRDNNFELTH